MSEADGGDSPDAVWQHDLRNAVNAAMLAVASGKYLLAAGEHARAMESMGRADVALRRIFVLLDAPPVASIEAHGDSSPG